ncbi:TIGR03009 domain-containing protein [Rhodopirellula sp.]|jgi:TIGR03009 family protein|nr:TIGR03009 domain-containing protein [Rhodopirellula sp.]
MMRLLAICALATLFNLAQSGGFQRALGQQNGQTGAQIARQDAGAALPSQPFPALNPAAQAQLQTLLLNWEQQSKSMKTLECSFTRWHYDMFAAPQGQFASRADGVIKYAAPDKGLFRVDRLVFFGGFDANQQAILQPQPGQFGEHWVCNGEQLIEFDRGRKECRVQTLPPEMRGQQIFNSPLPFVFNLDAQQIQQRYWVRQVQAPAEGMLLIEAWPKRQEDRAQYKLVQVALDAETFLPRALLMYAPNFHAKNAPKWDHYEFQDSKRNAIGAGFQRFLGNFIPEKPPSDWKILQNNFQAAAPLGVQQANSGTQETTTR